jgi:transcriptional regulator with XRE-family HTH domain
MENNHIRIILGMKVKQFRDQNSLSLQHLAKRSGMSASYLNEIEKGKKYPKAEKIMDLAKALGVDYNDLVSLKLGDGYSDLENVIHSEMIQKFPFHIFGITAQEVVQILAKEPERMGVLARMFQDIARNYDMRVEHFFFTALRSYQVIHKNHFPELERAADRLRKTLGWPIEHKITYEDMVDLLKERYKINVAEKDMGTLPRLDKLRSVLQKKGTLLINSKLSEPQRIFALAREVGYRFLEVEPEERAPSAPALEIGTFEMILNNFRAAYFAGAMLIPVHRLGADLKTFFRNKTWDPKGFVALLESYPATPEMFFHRLSEVIPQVFKTQRVHFLKFSQTGEDELLRLTKQLNMSQVHIPNGIGLKEHFCLRWLSVSIIKDLLKQPEQAFTLGVQRSNFVDQNREFFCFAMAYRGTLRPDITSSVTIGFQVDDAFKRTIRFWDDDSIPLRTLGQTCERCPLGEDQCEERAVPNSLFQQLQEREAQHSDLDALVAD